MVSASRVRYSRIWLSIGIVLYHPFQGEVSQVFSKRLQARMISGLDGSQRNIE